MTVIPRLSVNCSVRIWMSYNICKRHYCDAQMESNAESVSIWCRHHEIECSALPRRLSNFRVILLFQHPISRLRDFMMTPSYGNIFGLLATCAGNSPVPGEFLAQRPVTRSFDVFFDLRLDKRLRKQSWGWWFETLLHPLWRHGNAREIC